MGPGRTSPDVDGDVELRTSTSDQAGEGGVSEHLSSDAGPSSRSPHLIRRINDYIANWNGDCKPFTWTADAASILAKVKFVESQVRAITGH